MPKQLFNIEGNPSAEDTQQVLSIAVGERHCAFAITDKQATTLYKLVYYATTETEDNPLAAIHALHPELTHSFYKVCVSYDYPQNTLVPLQQYKSEQSGDLLKNLYGVNGSSAIISESIHDWQLYNVYAVPREVHEWVCRHYPAVQYWHRYTLDIKQMRSADQPQQIWVDFRTDDFTLSAIADNKLLLSQTFPYSTPEDVLYYLLKTCSLSPAGQSDLSQRDAFLSLSGLIDQQSVLYKELYQYFLHLGFRDAGWSPSGEHPLHFFTSLNDLARCAS
jgi:hypothetical protein